MQDATGLTTWTYDEAGRALTKTVTGIGLSTYAYDLTSGIDSLIPGYYAEQTTDPLGGITLKVYDKVDRLAQVTDAGETTQFEYYADGNRKSVTYPDGSKEVYSYNKIGQNTSLINLKADGTVIDTYSYTYDAAGNQTTKTDAKGTTTFTYDKLNRLAEVTEPSGIKTTYTFDKAGNRQGEKKYAGASLLQDTSYSYDLANRLTQTETKMNTTSETEKTLYSYDAAGNMISQSKTTIKPAPIGGQATFVLEKGKASADLVTLYAYDGFNQLKQSDDGINKITYAYNGFGLRTEKSAKANGNPSATVTKYLYEGDKIILELDGSGNKIAKNTFGTNLLSREMAETKVYYMYNGHGDVTALLSEAGAIVGTYYYDVWGNILEKNESEQITNPYRYAGYQYDDETGLYYLNARYYDAKIARFLTEDTVTGDRKDPLSLNRYAYCHNDPVRYKDPTGHREALDKYIEESDSEAARVARQKLEEANNKWKMYNDRLQGVVRGTFEYDEIKKYRDNQHTIAEQVRADYAKTSGDEAYSKDKYGRSASYESDQITKNKDTSKPLSDSPYNIGDRVIIFASDGSPHLAVVKESGNGLFALPVDLEAYEYHQRTKVDSKVFISIVIGFTPIDTAKDVADFIAGKDIITGEEINRLILLGLIITPEIVDLTVKSGLKNSDEIAEFLHEVSKNSEDIVEGGLDAIFKNGRVTKESISSNLSSFSGKSADEIADALRNQGYDVTVRNSTKSSSGAQIIEIGNAGNGRNITQVQVSPGGGRHGASPYIKISTSDQGIFKIVNGDASDYISNAVEKATIFFTGGK